MSVQDIFYKKMLDDERVNYFFEGVDMKKQRSHQVSVCRGHESPQQQALCLELFKHDMHRRKQGRYLVAPVCSIDQLQECLPVGAVGTCSD